MTRETGIGPVGAAHVPVMVGEAVERLRPRPGAFLVDATVGLGGHAAALLSAAPGAELLGLDRDPAALTIARERLRGAREAVVLRQAHFADLPEILRDLGRAGADAVLLDLGLSSLQLDDPARGFSFQAEGPLDMRMDPQSELTAAQVVNHFDERELADVIYEFGEERRSRRIARAIVRSRPILRTAQLAVVISAATRPMKLGQHKYDRIHPATRTFQAVRIFVNRELDDLRALLEVAPQVLKPGGRLVVISFHSLEDRIVKDAMREDAKLGQYRLLTKKPVTPSEEEIDRNPRARSAKLRAAERV